MKSAIIFHSIKPPFDAEVAEKFLIGIYSLSIYISEVNYNSELPGLNLHVVHCTNRDSSQQDL